MNWNILWWDGIEVHAKASIALDCDSSGQVLNRGTVFGPGIVKKALDNAPLWPGGFDINPLSCQGQDGNKGLEIEWGGGATEGAAYAWWYVGQVGGAAGTVAGLYINVTAPPTAPVAPYTLPLASVIGAGIGGVLGGIYDLLFDAVIEWHFKWNIKACCKCKEGSYRLKVDASGENLYFQTNSWTSNWYTNHDYTTNT